MNPNFRHTAFAVDEWPESVARRAADFHVDKAEHEREEGRDAKAHAHRAAAEMHVKAAFYFQRARISADSGKSTHAADHASHAKDALRDAMDLCSREGIEAPEALHNVLGVVSGQGPKVGGF